MKNSKNNFSTFAVALVTLFTVAGTTLAYATNNNSGNSPVSVKYVGTVNAAPIFQLSFTNETVEQYEIKIIEANDDIYTETITGKGLVRKFQFVNYGSDEGVLKVQIRNISTNIVITYKINPNTKVEVETELVASL